MASHDDHSNQTAPRAPSMSDTGEHTPHPRYDEQLEGDAFEVMRKYQVVTMPPNARLELMRMKLPEAPTELLQDTLPPNAKVPSPPPPTPAAQTYDDAEADFFDDARLQETTLVPRVARKRRANGSLVALVLGFLLALSVGASLWLARPPTPASTIAPVERAATPTPAVETLSTKSQPPEESPAAGSSAPTALPAKPASAVKAPPAPKATTEAKRPQPPTPQTERPQPPAPTTPPARGKQPWIDGL